MEIEKHHYAHGLTDLAQSMDGGWPMASGRTNGDTVDNTSIYKVEVTRLYTHTLTTMVGRGFSPM
jgi:hypothetical protein